MNMGKWRFFLSCEGLENGKIGIFLTGIGYQTKDALIRSFACFCDAFPAF